MTAEKNVEVAVMSTRNVFDPHVKKDAEIYPYLKVSMGETSFETEVSEQGCRNGSPIQWDYICTFKHTHETTVTFQLVLPGSEENRLGSALLHVKAVTENRGLRGEISLKSKGKIAGFINVEVNLVSNEELILGTLELQEECEKTNCKDRFAHDIVSLCTETREEDEVLRGIEDIITLASEKFPEDPYVVALICTRSLLHILAQQLHTNFYSQRASLFKTILCFLISSGANVNEYNDLGLTPLHYAAAAGNTDICVFLLSYSAEPTKHSEEGVSPLHHAAGSDNPMGVEFLLGAQADVNGKDNKGCTPLMRACEAGDKSMVNCLIRSRAAIDAVDHLGICALHRAAWSGNEVIASDLLSRLPNKEQVNRVDAFGFSILHTAVCSGNVLMVEILLDSNADVNTIDAFGQTPLFDAVRRGLADTVQLLIICGAHFNVVSNRNFTALHYACEHGQAKIVGVLEAYNAEIDSRDSDGRTPLHLAAMNSHFGTANILLSQLENEKDVNGIDKAGYTALHAVCGAINVTQRGLSLKTFHSRCTKYDVRTVHEDAYDTDYDSSLFTTFINAPRATIVSGAEDPSACTFHRVASVASLLRAQRTKSDASSMGGSKLSRLASRATVCSEKSPEEKSKIAKDNLGANGEESIVERSPKKADNDKAIEVTVSTAATEGEVNVTTMKTEEEVRRETTTRTSTVKDNSISKARKTLFSLPAIMKHRVSQGRIVSVSFGRSISLRMSQGENNSFWGRFAFGARRPKTVLRHEEYEKIMELSPECRPSTPHNFLPTIQELKESSRYTSSFHAVLMSPHGIGTSIVGEGEDSELNLNHDLTETALLLLERKADTNMTARNGSKPLDLAFEKNVEHLVALLLVAGSEVRMVDHKNVEDALGPYRVYQMFVDALVSNQLVNRIDFRGSTPLHTASAIGCINTVKKLIRNGATVDACDGEERRTTLAIAASRGHAAVVRELIMHGADVNAVDASNCTSLALAARGGHAEVVNYLMRHGADIYITSDQKQTALWEACGSGSFLSVTSLLEAKSTVNDVDALRGTCLMRASFLGHTSVARVLINAKADVSYMDQHGINALLGASIRGHASVVDLLISNRADVNGAETDYFQSPLQAAAYGGHVKVMKLLLDHGANINNEDDMGWSPACAAILGGARNKAAVMLLRDYGASLYFVNHPESMFCDLSLKPFEDVLGDALRELHQTEDEEMRAWENLTTQLLESHQPLRSRLLRQVKTLRSSAQSRGATSSQRSSITSIGSNLSIFTKSPSNSDTLGGEKSTLKAVKPKSPIANLLRRKKQDLHAAT